MLSTENKEAGGLKVDLLTAEGPTFWTSVMSSSSMIPSHLSGAAWIGFILKTIELAFLYYPKSPPMNMLPEAKLDLLKVPMELICFRGGEPVKTALYLY
jgi:hypothetical protein